MARQGDETGDGGRILDAAVLHVVFDGWSEATLKAAAAETGLSEALVRAHYPRGVVDLAAAYHRRDDARMMAALDGANLGQLRFRDRIARAVRLRLEGADREVVRRGAALFALPQNAVTGASLVWGTADAIWCALGDRSQDFNWYTKRATLSAVYSATVLFWLGDESAGQEETWAFLDRRIEDVMRIESAKARVRDNPTLSRVLRGPLDLMARIRPPSDPARDLPGRLQDEEPA